ncbi:MAG TPA: protein kinase, partial [Thermoanaerobaculia bacterium]|nr:protein kinase [Thermoanaerobaculia bacterium]
VAMTPDYASPEQVRGEAVTTATDVFSLGVILFELLTGERPHRMDTYSREEVEKAICREEPRKPSAANRRLDTDLDNIVLTALRKEPLRRYASVEQLSEDVRRYLEGRPVRARKDTLVYRTTKFVRRNKAGVAAAALAAVGIAAAIVAINRQAGRAEYRFQQVRKLAHSVLFELNPQIENLAGSTKARELLVKTSLAYLDSLAAEGGNDPELQLELAQAYEKVGDIQGDPKDRNLGQAEAGMRSYRKAISIAEKLDRSPDALELVASAYAKIGSLQRFVLDRMDDARASLRRAVEVVEAVGSTTGAPAYRIRVYVYGVQGDIEIEPYPERAIEPYRRALEIARAWSSGAPSVESRDYLSRAIGRLGAASMMTGDLPGARENFTAALRIAEKLQEEEPGNAEWRMRRANFATQIGLVSGYTRRPSLGDPRAAEDWLDEAMKVLESLASDRYDAWAQYNLFDVTGSLAAVIGDSEPARAEPLFRRSLALGEALLQRAPEDVDIRANEAGQRVDFGAVLSKLGRSAEALGEFRGGIEVLEGLHEHNPSDPSLAEDLGAGLVVRAGGRRRLGDGSGAEEDLRAAVRVLEPFAQQNPRNLLLLRDLADCHQGFGDLAASRSDWRRAEAEYRTSQELWERWSQVGVSSVYDRRHRDAVAVLAADAARRISKTSIPR